MAAEVRDANYRIEVAEDGIHVFNRRGALGWSAIRSRSSSAGRGGPTAAMRSIWAWSWRGPRSRGKLGKRYRAGPGLRWGVAADAEAAEDLTQLKEAGITLSHARHRDENGGSRTADADDPRKHRHHAPTPTASPHIAPLGLIEDGRRRFVVAPFAPSRTLENLRARPYLTASVTDDVRVFAGCLTGRRDWPVMRGGEDRRHHLAGAHAHRELEVVRVTEDAQRPRFHCRVVARGAHRPAPGFNRAQGAVIEAAILVSRLHMLPEEKIRASSRIWKSPSARPPARASRRRGTG